MKTAKSNIRLLVYGFFLATAMYNCKTKDVDSLTPFTYTFKAFENVTLPTVTATVPTAVSVTAATVTSSTAAVAVSSGLSGMSATGIVPASVKQAGVDMGKAISTTAAAQLTASFTPDVINTLVTTGVIPANLKAQLAALSSNPALKDYLLTFTLPTVDGKPVGGRVGAVVGIDIVATVATAMATLDDDACKAVANSAYNTAVAILKTSQTAQLNAFNTSFATIQKSINDETAACKAGLPAKYTPLRAFAQQAFNAGIGSLDLNKAKLGNDLYNLLKLLYLSSLSDANDLFTLLQNAESTSCDAVGAKKLANATVANNKDLSAVNGNYNSAIATLNAALAKAVASCHNQGNGG